MSQPAYTAMTGRERKDRSLVAGESAKVFFEAIRSRYTKEQYERRLITFLERLGMDVDYFVAKAKQDPSWGQKAVLDYMLKEKERFLGKEIEASSARSKMKPIKLLLEMNDVTGVNWGKVSKMMPPARRYALDRSPTVQELRQIVANSDLRFQAIILTMASSGIRVGAWDYLDWGHVEPLKMEGRVVAAKLTVYVGEPEEYVTFVTPEAYSKLLEYMRFREAHGEKVTPGSPLARDRWQTTRGGHGWNFVGRAEVPLRLQSLGVKRLFEDMMWRLGYRKQKKRRHEFSIHSVRKFFKTRAETAMRPINVETLVGHSTGISDSYYRPTDKELLEDYLNAVPLLTVSEAEEVRRESQASQSRTEDRIAHLEELVARIATQEGQQAASLGHGRSEGTSRGGASVKVVKAEEVENLITEGWEPTLTLPDGRVVMKGEPHDDGSLGGT
jgi:integrase